MPRALRVCSTSRCTELTRSGKCDECRRQASADRNAKTQQAYGPAWRRFSAAFLRRYPWCFACGAKAACVDHLDGMGPSGARGYDPSNLQSLCWKCHSSKTYRQDGAFGRWYADGGTTDG